MTEAELAKPEQQALNLAVMSANASPCAKSKRGVVLFHRETGVMGTGFNHPPHPFMCDGSVECREHCSKVCIHAEADALLKSPFKQGVLPECEMLHVKVVDGEAVPSGPPSCWQCSRLILASKVKGIWLLHQGGLRFYPAEEFHRITLHHHGLPIAGHPREHNIMDEVL